MAKTVFQKLNSVINGSWDVDKAQPVNTYNIQNNNDVILKTTNKEEYEVTKLQQEHEKLLAIQWDKAGSNIALNGLNEQTWVRAMCREADLMDEYPEISAALDIYMDETCTLNDKGRMLNIYSKSSRIKNILDDLFINKLQIHITLPMIARTMCKYGNDYHLLNVTEKGILGWKQLPTIEMERYDNDFTNGYGNFSYRNNGNRDDNSIFRWIGQNESTPYKSWQIAHFRLLIDSRILPYGTSVLSKSRRHWKMLTMMEDQMLIYRLERSMERRVFKIVIGNLEPKDATAYVQKIAETFKRTPYIDPKTGQLDLRRGIIGVDQDYFIPVPDSTTPSPIETLPSAQNITAIDDIKFIESKVVTGLVVPKPFISFDEATGDGKNLALLDIRFARRVNRIQQYLIMELNKIALTHLYLLGFSDDLNNFTITMNNPSTQAEILRVEELQKKLVAIKDAITPTPDTMPIMSWKRALQEILKYSEEDITNNLNEIRLEKALYAELQKTEQIIKRTDIFDPVDKIYGDPNAEYQEGQTDGSNGSDPFSGGASGFNMGEGDFDMEVDNVGEVDVQGNSSEVPISPEGDTNPMESFKNKNKKNIINENNKHFNSYINYIRRDKIKKNKDEEVFVNESFKSNDNVNSIINELNEIIDKDNIKNENIDINSLVNEIIDLK